MVGEFEFEELTSFLPKTVTQIYGEAASGKSNLCMIAAAEVAKSGKDVIFIDTEGSFSLERFKQIAGKDATELLKRVSLAEPSDFDEQKIAINKIADIMGEKKVGLVVVDSLVSLYRLEMGSTEDAYATNRELSKQLAKLMKIAKKYSVPIVVTNQVYSTFSKDGKKGKITPVGRDVLKYWTKVVIRLAKDGDSRIAEIIRHKFKGEGCTIRFKITQRGIKNEGIACDSAEELQG
jgi:DNA repair protein RadB